VRAWLFVDYKNIFLQICTHQQAIGGSNSAQNPAYNLYKTLVFHSYDYITEHRKYAHV